MLGILLCSIGILLLVCFIFVSTYLLPGMMTVAVFSRYGRQIHDTHQADSLMSSTSRYKIVETVDFSYLYPCSCSSISVAFIHMIHVQHINLSDPVSACCIERLIDPLNPSSNGYLVFIEDKSCGIGNMYRALASAFLLALVTNRTFYGIGLNSI